MLVSPRRLFAWGGLLGAAAWLAVGWFSAAAVGAEPKPRRMERPSHYIVENRRIENQLTRIPLPMVDWGFVLAGHVEYVDRTSGKTLPLNDPHDVEDPAQVEAVPMAVPSGVRLRVQPATKGGKFAECYPLVGDHLRGVVSWNGESDLQDQFGKTVYLAFRLRAAKLYSVAAE